MDDLKAYVRRVAAEIEMGERRDECPECYAAPREDDHGAVCDACGWVGDVIFDGYEWLNQRLDVEFIVKRDGEYLGARIAYTLGGPNVWIDTRRRAVTGAWGGDTATAFYSADPMDLDGAAASLWDCR